MKVTQLVSPAGFYGAERWIVALGRHLENENVDVDLLVIGRHPEQSEQLRDAWANLGLTSNLVSEAGRFDLRSIHKVARHLERHGVSILHTHGYKSDVIGLLAARWARTPIIITPHGFGLERSARLSMYAKIGMWAARRADVVAPLSNSLLETMRSSGVPEENLRMIPNAVDLHELDRVVTSKSMRTSDESYSIVYIGRLVSGKRVLHFIDIACELRKRGLRVRIDVVGEGPERENLENRIKQEHLERQVILHGFRADRLQLVAEADLFVLPSASEGTPRSVMEAMALGTPVAAYDIPGVRALITNEVTGLLASDGSVIELSEQCRRALVDKALSSRLADAARHHVRTAFSGSRLAADYAGLYRSMKH